MTIGDQYDLLTSALGATRTQAALAKAGHTIESQCDAMLAALTIAESALFNQRCAPTKPVSKPVLIVAATPVIASPSLSEPAKATASKSAYQRHLESLEAGGRLSGVDRATLAHIRGGKPFGLDRTRAAFAKQLQGKHK